MCFYLSTLNIEDFESFESKQILIKLIRISYYDNSIFTVKTEKPEP